MKVCLITLDFPPFRSSGLTIYAENLARGLVEWGHHVTVIAAERPSRQRLSDAIVPPGVQVLRMPIGALEWVGLGWQAARYLHRHGDRFDVIHFVDVHFAYAWHGSFVASAFQSFRQRLTADHGRPYHSGRLDYFMRRVYYTIARYLAENPSLHRARHLFMSSYATQSEFEKHYGVPPDRMDVIYPGIDLRPFQGLPDPKQARARLGLPLDQPILLYIGFSTPRKGVEYLARAFRALDKHALLVMVGKWEKNYLKKFMNALGELRSRVRIVGYVSDVEKRIYLAAADVFVFPTLLEGFGFPLVEAMAAGVPVITTSAGAAGEVVGDAGLVVPPADSAALANALNRFLSDPGLAERLRLAGPARAREYFDLQFMIAKIDQAYRNYSAGH